MIVADPSSSLVEWNTQKKSHGESVVTVISKSPRRAGAAALFRALHLRFPKGTRSQLRGRNVARPGPLLFAFRAKAKGKVARQEKDHAIECAKCIK